MMRSLAHAGLFTYAAVECHNMQQPCQDASQVPQERGVGRDQGDDYQLHPRHILWAAT